MTDREREAFEAWALAKTEHPVQWTGADNSVPYIGAYPLAGNVNAWLRNVWDGWQAAAARYEGVVEAARLLVAYCDEAEQMGSMPPRLRLLRDTLRVALAALDGEDKQ